MGQLESNLAGIPSISQSWGKPCPRGVNVVIIVIFDGEEN